MASEYRRRADDSLLYLPGVGLVRAGALVPEDAAVLPHVAPYVELVETASDRPNLALAPVADAVPGPAPEAAPERAVEPAVEPEMECPVEGYDGLNAIKACAVIEALRTMDALVAIEAYEAANKSRVSVLRKIAEVKGLFV